MKIKSYLSLLYLVGYIAVANASTDIEKNIVTLVNKGLTQSIKELEQVVNINSGTMNFSGVKQVGLIFQKQLDELDFNTQWLDGSEFNRAGHLVATYGTTGPKILMIGHLDTVFAKDDAFKSFVRISESQIAGPGITDMKGGDVIIVSALRVLKKLNLLNKVSIKVVMTGDEEHSGKPLLASKKAIIDAAKWADIALGFEDGDGNIGTAVVARRGSVGWTLDVEGKPAHSSQIFKEDIGYGAIFETARILNDFRTQLSSIDNLTFNPGLVVGGTSFEYKKGASTANAFGKSNVIAQVAKITGDIRVLSPEQLIDVKNRMQQITQNSLAHTSATLVFDDGYPPMAPTPDNYKLLSVYNNISQKLGYGEVIAVEPRNAGAADISFASTYVKMALDGMGLMGTGGHTKNEVADIASLEKNINKAAILIYRLSEKPI